MSKRSAHAPHDALAKLTGAQVLHAGISAAWDETNPEAVMRAARSGPRSANKDWARRCLRYLLDWPGARDKLLRSIRLQRKYGLEGEDWGGSYACSSLWIGAACVAARAALRTGDAEMVEAMRWWFSAWRAVTKCFRTPAGEVWSVGGRCLGGAHYEYRDHLLNILDGQPYTGPWPPAGWDFDRLPHRNMWEAVRIAGEVQHWWKHLLDLDPEAVVLPYDVTLCDYGRAGFMAWAKRVVCWNSPVVVVDATRRPPKAAWADGYTYRSLAPRFHCGAVVKSGAVHWELGYAPDYHGTVVPAFGTWGLPQPPATPTRVLRWRGGAP